MIDAFHFIRPWWLLTSLPLLWLVPWWFAKAKKQTLSVEIIAPHLQERLVNKAVASKRFPWLAASLIWLTASLAAAGPTWIEQPVPVNSQDRGYVLLFDASLDTRATDVTPDRHTQLKYKALDLIAELKDAQVGLVAYAGDAFTVAPLTRDARNLQHLLPALSPEIMPVPGRNPLSGFQQAHEMLVQAGYASGDIYWFSGSINRNDMEDIRRFLREHPHRVSAIVAGTEDGAPVRTQQGELLRTPQGELVIPRLFRSYFEEITRPTGGIVRQAKSDPQDINALLALPEQTAQNTEQLSIEHDQWLDMGPYLLWLLIPLWLYFARKTQLLSIALPLVVLTTLSFSPSPVVAATPETTPSVSVRSVIEPIQEAFRNREQRAIRAYQQSDFSRVEQVSEDPMLLGMAAYRAENYESAIQYFEQLNTAEAHYNRGNSLAYAGKLEAAIHAYDEALALRPQWTEALENKEIVESMKDQQESNSEQQSDDAQQQNDQGEPDQSPSDTTPQENDSEDESSGEPSTPNENEQQDESEQDPMEENQESQATEESSSEQAQSSIPEAWEDLSEEERAQLEQLLRRLPDDPALLLRNRLLLEAERRRLRQFN